MLSLVVRAITQAFVHGAFISTFSSYLEANPEFKVFVKVGLREMNPECILIRLCQSGAPIYGEIGAMASSHAMMYMGSLSKLCSRSISLYVDYRPKLALPPVHETFRALETIATKVEAGWLDSSLAEANEESIGIHLLSSSTRRLTSR